MTTEPHGVVIPSWTFADRLRKARLIAGLSQEQFAQKLGAKAGAYAQWEAGNNQPRDIVSVARRVELVTRIPASWTLGLGDPPPGGETVTPAYLSRLTGVPTCAGTPAASVTPLRRAA